MTNNNQDLEIDIEENSSSKRVWFTAIGTGVLFWTSLFGLIFFCLRT